MGVDAAVHEGRKEVEAPVGTVLSRSAFADFPRARESVGAACGAPPPWAARSAEFSLLTGMSAAENPACQLSAF